MKVQNMISDRTGREAPNQFIIRGDHETTFQSYNSVIAKKRDGRIYLDINMWDCSKTTGKYRNQFLGETKKETEAKIRNGTYILVDLNN